MPARYHIFSHYMHRVYGIDQMDFVKLAIDAVTDG